MSFAALNWAFRLPVKGAVKAVVIALADHARQHQGNRCWPSADRIALWSGLQRRAVLKALGDAEAAGLIQIERTSGKASIYTLVIPAGAETEADAPVQQMHPCTTCTGAPDAPPRVHEMHHPRAPDGPLPVHEMHPNQKYNQEDNHQYRQESPPPLAPANDLLGQEDAESGNDLPKRAVAIWNSTAGLPRVMKTTPARRTALRRRLADEFGLDLERWRAYCQLVASVPFLAGVNDRGWRADLDWSLKPQSIARVQEGFYANRKVAHPAALAGGGLFGAAIRMAGRRQQQATAGEVVDA